MIWGDMGWSDAGDFIGVLDGLVGDMVGIGVGILDGFSVGGLIPRDGWVTGGVVISGRALGVLRLVFRAWVRGLARSSRGAVGLVVVVMGGGLSTL